MRTKLNLIDSTSPSHSANQNLPYMFIISSDRTAHFIVVIAIIIISYYFNKQHTYFLKFLEKLGIADISQIYKKISITQPYFQRSYTGFIFS